MTGAGAAPDFTDFDALAAGDSVKFSKTLAECDVEAFAALSGDYNPIHMDADYVRRTHLGRRVVHGMLVASYVSTLIGMRLPGAGSLWTQQTFRWRNPVFLGDTLEFTLRVTHKSAGTRTVSLEVTAMNQNGKLVMDGEGTVSLPEVRRIPQEISIHERTAFISGGSRGIGAAVAQALARAGAPVVINYWRSAAEAEDLCQSIVEAGGSATAVRADVNDPEQVNRAIEVVQAHLGRTVDVLIHCAGGPATPRPVTELEWTDIQQALDMHVRGAFLCAQAVIPGMMQRKSGRIVNIGSMAAWGVPPVQWSAFAMAKAALRSLTKSLAAELGPSGIRVNMISPGTTETGGAFEIPERLRKLQAMQTPLRRLAVPEDIAETAVFLCSEASQFITGADIPVCGGVGM
jgi:3-oxoacyl-[acyl-carrier protein] reductase